MGSGAGRARAADDAVVAAAADFAARMGAAPRRASGEEGPIQQAWRRIGGVTAIAAGAFGEVSAGVDVLLQEAAEHRARYQWRRLGFESAADARAASIMEMRAVLGIALVREQAHLLRRRLPLAMPPVDADRFRNLYSGARRPPAEGIFSSFGREAVLPDSSRGGE